MQLKPEQNVKSLLEALKAHAQELENGVSQLDYPHWFAARMDQIESTLRHYLEGSDVTDGLFTDRYWHVLQRTVPANVYGQGIFRQEIDHQVWRLERIIEQFEQVQRWAVSTKTVTVMPDTNVLVHCGEVTAIDWTTVAGTPSVRVLIPLVVVDELDELKRTARDKSDREAIRANIRLLRQMLANHEAGQEVALDGEVTFAVLPDPRGHRRLPTNDEEICDRAALVGQFSHVVLATNDYGMHMRALVFGLTTVEVSEGQAG